jgi:hypothetical protein
VIEWIKRLFCLHHRGVAGQSGPDLWYQTCWKCGHTEYWEAGGDGEGDDDGEQE